MYINSYSFKGLCMFEMKGSIQHQLQSHRLPLRHRPSFKTSRAPSPVKDAGKFQPEEVAIKDHIPENNTLASFLPETPDLSPETSKIAGLHKQERHISINHESKEEEEVKDSEEKLKEEEEVKDSEEKLAFTAFRLYRKIDDGESMSNYNTGLAVARDALACAFWMMACS
ncbi:uncharacterized protein LOC110007007 isoform X2 [Amborella trichopoda]|uniref:uncharacterized protein LOC110007007 isoform X2 n=1 Tax=Amborella trichopoda TaxID=13333 RepID=UPI0009C16D60|nr:uncharacterized protein LOC110007007 isoform X2 [Amborella trichopoda]|eukprot:XP_020521221.1 uncharacterized protein LOC110007007 isoform X2 [Amborella trichopoda]